MQKNLVEGKTVNLELLGVDSNAFSILGAFRRAARQQGWTKEDIKIVTEQAMSGNYNHLLTTIMVHTDQYSSTGPENLTDWDQENGAIPNA